jgi:hypothetical protein
MNTFKTLLLREWLQHRFGWTLVVAIPLGLASIGLLFGQIELEFGAAELGPRFATLLAMGTGFVAIAVMFGIAWATSLILVSGLPRRDHTDRSHEFWLSLPVGDAPSLCAPLLVHLLLVPMAGIAIGLVASVALSAIVVGRLAGLADWFALPWGALLTAGAAAAARLAGGLVVATLWLAPVVSLALLANAWLKRWGAIALLVGILVIAGLLDGLFGIELMWRWLETIGNGVLQGLVGRGGDALSFDTDTDVQRSLLAVPGLAARDFGFALQGLANAWMPLGLAIAAASLWGVARWRRATA